MKYLKKDCNINQNINIVGDSIYRARYIIAFLFLLFLTIGKFHGDSMAAYDYFIQPGLGSENLYPVAGEARIVRSDEWVVSTPAKLASTFGEHPFSRYNRIQRGTDTLNILNGIEINIYSVIRNPFTLGWLMLDKERAFSLYWYAPIIMAFLIGLEFFYIIGERKKTVALLGAILTVFSSFYLWWGFPTTFWSLEGCIVCCYYFIHKKKIYQKVLFSLGFVSAFLNFITPLYPAWQVPFGLIALMIGIYIIHENIDQIKQIRIKEWSIFAVAIVTAIGLIGFYMWDTMEYVKAIQNTVYPGARQDCGGYFLNKLFYYFQSIEYAYKDLGVYAQEATASEKSAFFSLFPLPTIAAAFLWFQNKKKNWFCGLLLLLEIPMLFYVTTGLPAILAKCLLFTLSTRIRMVDAIGYIQILLICYIAGRTLEYRKNAKFVCAIVAVLAPICAFIICKIDFPEYIISKKYILIVSILSMIIGIGIFAYRKYGLEYVAVLLCVLISLRTGWMIRPVMKGLDAIYSKPVAGKIMELQKENPDAKWMCVDMEFVCSGFLVACGVPTINSVNTYPNMELWKTLDSEGKYEEEYNRYAHVVVHLTEESTSMELIAADNMLLNLSYQDIKKTDVTYMMSKEEIKSNEICQFEKVYDEAGIFIYKVGED